MKIWFDILTPKQLVFAKPMVERLARKHDVLCTSRRYGEVNSLARIWGFPLKVVGKHGGGDRHGKLAAGIDRMKALARQISEYSPDLAISFCSPDAARVSYGLGVRHVSFLDAPHAEAQTRLVVPLAYKLLIPWVIPKKMLTKYGIAPENIIQYRGLDAAITMMRKAPGALPRFGGGQTVLIRPPESQAAYITKKDVMGEIIRHILAKHKTKNIVVLPRYVEQKKRLEERFGGRIRVLMMSYDGKALLDSCDVFIGSGGTMTYEAALLGVPTISYNFIPNLQEKYLVKKRLVRREERPERIAAIIDGVIASRDAAEARAKREVAAMEDPYTKLAEVIRSMQRPRTQ